MIRAVRKPIERVEYIGIAGERGRRPPGFRAEMQIDGILQFKAAVQPERALRQIVDIRGDLSLDLSVIEAHRSDPRADGRFPFFGNIIVPHDDAENRPDGCGGAVGIFPAVDGAQHGICKVALPVKKSYRDQTDVVHHVVPLSALVKAQRAVAVGDQLDHLAVFKVRERLAAVGFQNHVARLDIGLTRLVGADHHADHLCDIAFRGDVCEPGLDELVDIAFDERGALQRGDKDRRVGTLRPPAVVDLRVAQHEFRGERGGSGRDARPDLAADIAAAAVFV